MPSPNTHTSAPAAHQRGWSAARGGSGGSSALTAGAYAAAPPIGEHQQTLKLMPNPDSPACRLTRSRPLSHKTSCHPSPQKQVGTPAQLREPTRTPLLYSRPVTRSPRKTPEGAKREEGGENAVIFLRGSRATGAPLSPQANRASKPKWPRIPRSSLPMGRSGDS